MNGTNLLRIISILLLLLISPLFISAQNLEPDEELYLRDPDPRFNGPQVKELQRFLLFCGEDIGSDGMDGWFGKDTQAALISYQASRGLEQTGRITPSDFSIPLIWTPYLLSTFNRGLEEGPFPGHADEAIDYRPTPEGNLRINGYYGSIEIPSSEIRRQGYQDFSLSPEGRFLAVMGKDPADSDQWIGNHIKVWDILSGGEIQIYAYEIALDPNTEGLLEGYSSPNIKEFFWNKDYFSEELRLIALIDLQVPSGDTELSVMILYPYRYEKP